MLFVLEWSLGGERAKIIRFNQKKISELPWGFHWLAGPCF